MRTRRQRWAKVGSPNAPGHGSVRAIVRPRAGEHALETEPDQASLNVGRAFGRCAVAARCDVIRRIDRRGQRSQLGLPHRGSWPPMRHLECRRRMPVRALCQLSCRSDRSDACQPALGLNMHNRQNTPQRHISSPPFLIVDELEKRTDTPKHKIRQHQCIKCELKKSVCYRF